MFTSCEPDVAKVDWSDPPKVAAAGGSMFERLRTGILKLAGGDSVCGGAGPVDASIG